MRISRSVYGAAAGLLFASLALSACGGNDADSQPVVDEKTANLPTANVTVAGVERKYTYYLPSNLDALKAYNIKNIRVVVSFPENGETAAQNAQKTRWHEVAEEKGFVVIYPEPLNGTWNTNLASNGPNDLAYVHAAWSDIRTKFNVSDTNAVYPTGFRSGGAMASQLALMGPVPGYLPPIAAVAAIDGTADPAVFRLPETKYTYPSAPGNVTIAPETTFGNSLPNTTMSVWLISSNDSTNFTQQADYWKAKNRVSTPTESTNSGVVSQSFKNSSNPLQEVRLSKYSEGSLSGKSLSAYLWENMFKGVIRFKNDDRQNGTLNAFKTESELRLIDETVKFSDQAKGSRRFLTYVPSNYAELVAKNGSVPVMFNFHGIRGSGWWQAINTDYVDAAEKNGFIVVFPQGVDALFNSDISKGVSTVNYDVKFTLELIDYLKTKYKVDSTRIFAGGVSAGSWFANRLIVEYPQLFAGAALCYSGHLNADVYKNYQSYPQVRTDVPIPVWQCRGGTEGPTTFPGGEAGQEAARNFWRVVVNGHVASATEDAAVPTESVTAGPDNRKHIHYFRGGKADYAWSTTDYVPHFWHPGGQADLMWKEMFAHYSRNSDGTLKYQP
ncbi:alpha/beta hydrolase family esterase [Comamonas testosteroni]|uniref:alpha/beta hydrolase family esterase n=1 Tax=Comamonas testosteroni TaxID=285 RepID=UPI00389B2B4D